jgi:hypothetical protein
MSHSALMSGGSDSDVDTTVYSAKNKAHWPFLFGNNDAREVHNDVARLFSYCLGCSFERSIIWASRFVERGYIALDSSATLESRSPIQMANLFNHTFDLPANSSMNHALEILRSLMDAPGAYFQNLGLITELRPLLLLKMFTTVARSDPEAEGMEGLFEYASNVHYYFESLCIQHSSEGGPSFEEFSMYFVQYHILKSLSGLNKLYRTISKVILPSKSPSVVVKVRAAQPRCRLQAPFIKQPIIIRELCPPPGATGWPPPFAGAHKEEIRFIQYLNDSKGSAAAGKLLSAAASAHAVRGIASGVLSRADPTLEPLRQQLVPTSKSCTLEERKTHSSSSNSFVDEPAAEFEIFGIYISEQSHTESLEVVASRSLVTPSSRSSSFVSSLKKGLCDHSRQVAPQNVHYGVSSAISCSSSSMTPLLPRHVGVREFLVSLSILKVNDPILAALLQSCDSIWPPFYGIFWLGWSEQIYIGNVLMRASKHLPASELLHFFMVAALHMFQVAGTWLHCSENLLSAVSLSVSARFLIGCVSLVSSRISTSLLHSTGWNAFLITRIQLASGNMHLRIVQKSALSTHPPVCPSLSLSLPDYLGSGLDRIVAAVSHAASYAIIARTWSPSAVPSTVFSAAIPSTYSSWVYQPGTDNCIAQRSTVLVQHETAWKPLFCFLQQVVASAWAIILGVFVSALSGRLQLRLLLPLCCLEVEAGPAMFCSGNPPPVRLPRPKPEEAGCTFSGATYKTQHRTFTLLGATPTSKAHEQQVAYKAWKCAQQPVDLQFLDFLSSAGETKVAADLVPREYLGEASRRLGSRQNLLAPFFVNILCALDCFF